MPEIQRGRAHPPEPFAAPALQSMKMSDEALGTPAPASRTGFEARTYPTYPPRKPPPPRDLTAGAAVTLAVTRGHCAAASVESGAPVSCSRFASC